MLLLLTVRGFLMQTKFDTLKAKAKWIGFFGCVLYGGSLEIMQGTLFEERSADIYDFIANSFGCLVGLWLYPELEKMILVKFIK